jgi:hypothetical protein
LGERPEAVYRLAGLLPPVLPSVDEEEEALSILRSLPARTRALIMTQLRALQRVGKQAGSFHTTDQPSRSRELASGDADDIDLERQLVKEFRRLPPRWQQHAIEEVERLQSLHSVTVRIIGDEEEEEYIGSDEAQENPPA